MKIKTLKLTIYIVLINIVFLSSFGIAAVAANKCQNFLDKSEVKSIQGCPFCEAHRSHTNQEFPKHFDQTLIVFSKNRNFFLKVQRGGFLEGTVLITSRNHSLTRISDMNKDEFFEFLEFYKTIELDIKSIFGISHLIAFENGTTGSDTIEEANLKDSQGVCRADGGGCLSHFHWHINSLETQLNPNQKKFEIPNEAIRFDTWDDFFIYMGKYPNKLYTLILYQGEIYFVDRSIHKRRSEWIRLLIALHLKLEGLYPMKHSYSWRKQPNDDISMETLNKLKGKYEFDRLPLLPKE